MPTEPDSARASEFRVLLDMNVSYSNPVPPRVPAIDNNEWLVAEVLILEGYTNVTFTFNRQSDSVNVFAPNCHVSDEDGELYEQEAFNDAPGSEDECDLEFRTLTPGTYYAVYSDDGLQPGGTHELRLRVTGWYLTPADDRT